MDKLINVLLLCEYDNFLIKKMLLFYGCTKITLKKYFFYNKKSFLIKRNLRVIRLVIAIFCYNFCYSFSLVMCFKLMRKIDFKKIADFFYEASNNSV